MKSIKTLGLAAVAALAAMAFVGVSSAMAEHTALCADDEALCAEPIEHIHETSVGNMTLLNGALNVICKNVLFLGDTLAALANPLIIHGAFTYPELECNNGSCIVEEENGPAEVKVLKEGNELAKVTMEWLIHVICIGFINCRYNGVGLVGHRLGPLRSTQLFGEVSMLGITLNKESGPLCPTTAKLDLVTTPLEPIYISS